MKYIFEGFCLGLCLFLCSCGGASVDSPTGKFNTTGQENSIVVESGTHEIASGDYCDTEVLSTWNLEKHLTKLFFTCYVCFDNDFADAYVTIDYYDSENSYICSENSNKFSGNSQDSFRIFFDLPEDAVYYCITAIHYSAPNYKILNQKCAFDNECSYESNKCRIEKLSNSSYQYVTSEDIVIGLFNSNGIQVDTQVLLTSSKSFNSVGIDVQYYKILGERIDNE